MEAEEDVNENDDTALGPMCCTTNNKAKHIINVPKKTKTIGVDDDDDDERADDDDDDADDDVTNDIIVILFYLTPSDFTSSSTM